LRYFIYFMAIAVGKENTIGTEAARKARQETIRKLRGNEILELGMVIDGVGIKDDMKTQRRKLRTQLGEINWGNVIPVCDSS